MIKNLLFDLDGTLLPMDQDLFVEKYFKALAMKLSKYGYEPKKLIQNVYAGTMTMIKNHGEYTNEEVFWNLFKSIYGDDVIKDIPTFEEFYKNEFIAAKEACGFNENSRLLIKRLKEEGYNLILATNPIFPEVATKERIKWAGLDFDDFTLVTTYENSHYCKPNLKYYSEILEKLNLNPKESIMIGNDVGEDMVSKSLGLKVFLLTDCLINKVNHDINIYPNGGFKELNEFINNIIKG